MLLLQDLRFAVIVLLLRVNCLHGSNLFSASSYEFTAYRMQQYNLSKQNRGCRGAIVVAEARAADEPVLTRRCVVMRVADFTTKTYAEARRQNAAAVLILLPQNMTSIFPEEIQSFMMSESQALMTETLMPVYVAPEDQQLLHMYEEVKKAASARTSSIFIRVFRSMVTATAFQILVTNNSPIKAITDTTLVTLEGVLLGAGEDIPTIVITAHYDSYGLAPWLSYGADSNGSGVIILLELARLFQMLYSSPSTRPRYHLMFSLTGGGKQNFFGTKKWIEENLDHAESSLLHDNVAFVLCLDTLANGDELYTHVSRPPKSDTPMYAFIQHLDEVVSSIFPWMKTQMVHKKINLMDSTVAWEHERFSLRRIPAFTLSHLDDPKSELRGSMLDTASRVDFQKIKRNGIIVAEALARYMYHLSDKSSLRDVRLFKGRLDFHDSRIFSLMSFLTSVPRATQLMDKEPAHILLINSLEHEFKQYLQQVHRHTFRQDKRDPDITFFDQMSQPVVMYRVKPAAFDLFLGGCITAYLGIVYYAIQNFDHVYTKLKAAVKPKRH
ncbi:nicalin-1-like [Hippocampus zosterae]|uniref:nicalin-1-like n=1 Tax=Hippocampus zosterae TaxID=109293 RepID=UPI00223D34A4|nr:nicalin-1-like [Hippocampus zosterae]XP_051933227.1 nicalin-1-like [Hippocampus zosterae]XP_051933228.1 nicalin-1-like [Hippocampus zosterae]